MEWLIVYDLLSAVCGPSELVFNLMTIRRQFHTVVEESQFPVGYLAHSLVAQVPLLIVSGLLGGKSIYLDICCEKSVCLDFLAGGLSVCLLSVCLSIYLVFLMKNLSVYLVFLVESVSGILGRKTGCLFLSFWWKVLAQFTEQFTIIPFDVAYNDIKPTKVILNYSSSFTFTSITFSTHSKRIAYSSVCMSCISMHLVSWIVTPKQKHQNVPDGWLTLRPYACIPLPSSISNWCFDKAGTNQCGSQDGHRLGSHYPIIAMYYVRVYEF